MSSEERKSVEFHVKVDDYFVTLATVMDLMLQQSEKELKEFILSHEENTRQLKLIKNDLLYLQGNFKIIKRDRA